LEEAPHNLIQGKLADGYGKIGQIPCARVDLSVSFSNHLSLTLLARELPTNIAAKKILVDIVSGAIE
jgi:hypothetical protein